MSNDRAITSGNWTISDIREILQSGDRLFIDADVLNRVEENREFLEKKIDEKGNPIYGINTGFGSLCDTVIPSEDLAKLQRNLVLSHACGTGDEVAPELVKLMLLLKIKGLAQGFSGVRPVLLEKLAALYNNEILPIVFEQGSLGASGDLAPLAHMSLPLLGEGMVRYNGNKVSAIDALASAEVAQLELKAKEGLALLNGTQFMSAHGVWVLMKLEQLGLWADVIGALSLEAYNGRLDAFDALLNDVRSHPGQAITSSNIRKVMEGSSLEVSSAYTQDPYSFRCMPQVHGACRDAWIYVKNVVETEVNSVTDNPTVFDKDGKVISGGNFHGQPLAMAFDYLAISVAELGSISERRVYKLISGTRGLPGFLVENPGLNSGFMIPQYAAASVVSQNRQLAVPASVDTIDSSNGQEDHVSMGANGATRLVRMVNNLQTILGVELLTAMQALDIRGKSSSDQVEELRKAFRQEVPRVENDRWMHPLMQKSAAFIGNHDPRNFFGGLETE